MSTQQTTGDKIYTVVAGDTLGALANRFHTTVKQLQIWNNIPDPNIIPVGLKLIVGKSAVGEPAPAGTGLVPFPGVEWFKALPPPESPIVLNMGQRLADEGCGEPYGFSGPGPRWNERHRQAYALWQQQLGFSGPDADGWPGRSSWDRLRVPEPTPEQWGSD
ncbi:peptidoglycan-binding protein [Streptomyces sp. NPDC020742]|uniref:peptidoglycan-binding protein n=1 Tax=unclassified Streptomyces TaxID=2593676 RepID=UPI0033C4B07E